MMFVISMSYYLCNTVLDFLNFHIMNKGLKEFFGKCTILLFTAILQDTCWRTTKTVSFWLTSEIILVLQISVLKRGNKFLNQATIDSLQKNNFAILMRQGMWRIVPWLVFKKTNKMLYYPYDVWGFQACKWI